MIKVRGCEADFCRCDGATPKTRVPAVARLSSGDPGPTGFPRALPGNRPGNRLRRPDNRAGARRSVLRGAERRAE